MRLAGALAAILCCFATAGAAAAGAQEPDGYRLDNYRAPVPDTLKGAAVLHAAELQAAIRRGAALIDVLPAPRRPEGMQPDAPWMPEKRMDIPGSVWLPDVGRGAISDALDAWFRAALAHAVGEDKHRLVVFYCLASCWMSWNAAKRAMSYGYANVAWYPDGTDGWAASGQKLVEAAPVPGAP